MKKADCIKLLEAMSQLAYDLAQTEEAERDEAWKGQLMTESIAYDTAALILTKPSFAKAMWEIHYPEEVNK